MTAPLARFDRAIFAADFHLRRDAWTEDHAAFAAFLDRLPADGSGLFLLGDLFEFWVGPEDVRQPSYAGVLAALARAAGRGVPIVLIPGNRDFLVGGEIERSCRIRVAEGAMAVRLGGFAAYLAHGDRFCLRDRAYQRMTALIRSATLRGLWLNLPARIRTRFAGRLRSHSQGVVAAKAARTLEPVWEEVIRVLSSGYDVIIAGHIHRRTERTVEIGGRSCRFLSVGPWPEYLAFDGERFETARAG
ncbi:MAG: UDP-2,3-diacylglucosamine diphosphatase [Planctomycetes bacterium]|nr:UDP-2,3-diacylglucosamine diphosphatase [Planctomycetota bacterium]